MAFAAFRNTYAIAKVGDEILHLKIAGLQLRIEPSGNRVVSTLVTHASRCILVGRTIW